MRGGDYKEPRMGLTECSGEEVNTVAAVIQRQQIGGGVGGGVGGDVACLSEEGVG